MTQAKLISRIICIIILLANGCKVSPEKTVENRAPNEPISISPFPPVAGKSITISYNTSHTKALYKTPQPLYTTVTITTQTEILKRRLLLSKDSYGKLSSPVINIPANSAGIDISISPLNVYMTQEHFNTPCADERQNPMKGGLPFAMKYTSHNYQEAIELFHEDERLYPNDYERYAKLWYGEIKSGMNKHQILLSIDSIWNYLNKQNTLSPDQELGVAACAMSYALIDMPTEAATAIHYLTKNSDVHTEQRYGMCEVIDQLFYKTLGELKNKSNNGMEWQHLFERTSEFTLTHPHLKFLFSTFAVSPEFQIRNDILLLNETIQKVYKNISKKLISLSNQKDILQITAGNPGIWSIAAYTMEAINELDDAATLFTIGKQLLEILPEWVSTDNSSPVSIIPLGSLRSDYARGYFKVATKLLLPQKADSIIAWAWSYPITSFSKGSYSLLASTQATFYVQSQNIDSAEKYCALAIYLHAVSSTDLFTQLQKLRSQKGKAKETVAQFKERTTSFSLSLDRIPSMVLQTHEVPGNKSVNIADIKDTTTYLFFSSKTCSVCRLFIPKIVPAIVAVSSTYRAIIVTDEPIEVARKAYGKDAAYVIFQPDMQMMFGVAGFPTVLKVKNGFIVERFDGLSEGSTNEIISQVTKQYPRQK
jgi:thiol-disulfide isomerase/thioredoxin